MRAVTTAVVLFTLWIAISGVYQPLTIGFGVMSAVVASYVVHRMNVVDQDPIPLKLHPVRMARYWGWLMVQIIKSNIVVTRVILSPNMPIRPNFFATRITQKTELAQVIFANSITLTPATVTVETGDDHLWVHALAFSDGDPEALDDMNARVRAIETEKVG